MIITVTFRMGPSQLEHKLEQMKRLQQFFRRVKSNNNKKVKLQNLCICGYYEISNIYLSSTPIVKYVPEFKDRKQIYNLFCFCLCSFPESKVWDSTHLPSNQIQQPSLGFPDCWSELSACAAHVCWHKRRWPLFWSERSACAALGCWYKRRWPLF